MQMDDSSFREMYLYPNDPRPPKQRKHVLKGSKNKRGMQETNEQKKETFYSIVQKVKNVALFVRNIKKPIAEKQTFEIHNLKEKELQYLESDAQAETIMACFRHDNAVILGVEIIYIACMMLYFWQCTFEIVFGEMPTNQIINGISLLFYIIHIALFQVTQYKNQKSELIVDAKLIREIYWNQRMIKDAISLIVIMLQLTPLDSHQISPPFFILRVLSLLSYSEMASTFEKVQNLLVRSMKSQTIMSLIKLLFQLLFFLHLISIILNLMATVQRLFHVPVVWLDNSNINFSNNFDQYIIGWYWGATIFSTVGFGEIIPANNVERFVVSFLEIFCCLTFGYYINAIGQIIKMRAESSQKYEKEVRKLNRYLNDLVLTNDLKHKIRTHYFNKHLIEQKHDPNEQKEVLSTITPNLKASLLEQVNMKLVRKSNILQKFKGQTIKNLSQAIKRIILAPEYILYSRNSSERKLWLIESGTVQQLTDKFVGANLRKVISLYDDKNHLVGWINFLLPGTYKSIAKAKNFTIAHELQQSQFIKCLGSDIVDYHKYLQMKHQMIEKSKNKYFEKKCISCGRYTHNVIDCDRIHLVKKSLSKVAKDKVERLDKFRSTQNRKIKRSQLKINWKELFGNKKLEKEAYLLNNGKDLGNGTIENYLKKLAFRDSVNSFERRKASGAMVIIPRDLGIKQMDNLRQTNKGVQNNERSFVSFDSEDQQGGIQFEKAFYNKDLKSYMPSHDIEIILNDYHKKVVKKRLDSSKNIAKAAKV